MNIWARMSIVLTAIWSIAVISYATYEYVTFPMKPLTDYLGMPDSFYVTKAENFIFIKIATYTNGENLSSAQRKYLDNWIEKAESEKEKEIILNARNYPTSRSALNSVFVPFLFGTTMLVWTILFATYNIIKWIIVGHIRK